MFLRLFLVFLSISYAYAASSPQSSQLPHVCIIGAGISGASVAHFLSLHPNPPEVTVFERSDQVGGRVRTLNLPGVNPINAGASIIAHANELMSYYVRFLNLTRAQPRGLHMGLWNGHEFVFREHPTSSYRTIFSAFYRYGLSILKVRNLVKPLLRSYASLYPRNGADWVSSGTVRGLLERVQLYELTQTPFNNTPTIVSSSKYRQEIVAAITRVNYGQEVNDMNALAGMVALAGSGDALWSVDGGNQRVIQGLFDVSNARLKLSTHVRQVKYHDGTRYVLKHKKLADNAQDEETSCDAVVLAAPFEHCFGISFPPHVQDRLHVGRGEFQMTVATFVRGKLNEETFGNNPPDAILTTEAVSKELFTSVSQVGQGPEGSIFKVFSKKSLSVAALERIFAPDNWKVLEEYPWRAYPKFNPPERFADFNVDGKGFFYTSTLESAGSAMEMSAVAGANVAQLVREKFLVTKEKEIDDDGAKIEL